MKESQGRTGRARFAELRPVLRAWIGDMTFLTAPQRAVRPECSAHACCARYRLPPPRTPFTCTVQFARTQW